MTLANASDGRRKRAAVRALPCEIPTEAIWVWSILWRATRSPFGSTTEMANFQLRGDFVASAITAAMAFSALASVIDSPYGISNGIWSGTGAAGAVAISACAAVAADNAVHATDHATTDLRIKSSQSVKVPSDTPDGCIIGCRI